MLLYIVNKNTLYILWIIKLRKVQYSKDTKSLVDPVSVENRSGQLESVMTRALFLWHCGICFQAVVLGGFWINLDFGDDNAPILLGKPPQVTQPSDNSETSPVMENQANSTFKILAVS